MTQNRVVGPFYGNMERNPANYGNPWQASGITSDGCYPGQMPGIWAPGAMHPLDTDQRMQIEKDQFVAASHTLTQLKTASPGMSGFVGHGTQGLHTGHVTHPNPLGHAVYGAPPGLHQQLQHSAHSALLGPGGQQIHNMQQNASNLRMDNGLSGKTPSHMDNIPRKHSVPISKKSQKTDEVLRNKKSSLLSRHSKDTHQPRKNKEHLNQKNPQGDANSMSQNLSRIGQESRSSGDDSLGHNQINASDSANWKDFLSGLRTGTYEMSDSYRHHLDPGNSAPLPEDFGKSDEEPSQSESSKAPKQTPKKTKAMEAKEALNKGQEHLNPKGKLIRARKMGEGCAAKGCRFRCEERISKEARTNIFNYFWNLGNHQLQWLFIAMHTSVRLPKQRTQDPAKSRRKTSRSYFFRQGIHKIPVCKTMFLQTLDVSDSWVDTAITKAANGVAVAPDCRGRHSKKAEGMPVEKKKRRRKKKGKNGEIEGNMPQDGGLALTQNNPNSLNGNFVGAKPTNLGQNPGVVGNNLGGNLVPGVGNPVDRLGPSHLEGYVGGRDCAPSELDLLSPRIDLHVGDGAHTGGLGQGLGQGLPPWMGALNMSSATGTPGGTASPGVIFTTAGALISPPSTSTQEPVLLPMDIQPPQPPPVKKRKRADVSIALGAVATGLGVGVGGLLGAASVPEAFRHHLDPNTLALRELPNGAIIAPARQPGYMMDEDEEDDDIQEITYAKPNSKRSREPKKWRANQCKEALNTGKEHVNLKGKLVRARRLKEGCGGTCRFRCNERIMHSDREAIFNHFWSLGDHKLQWLFISRHTRVRTPKHRTTNVSPELARRKTSRSYFFTVFRNMIPPLTTAPPRKGRRWHEEGEELPVCKTMFLRTLDVSDSWVESAIAKVHKNKGNSGGLVEDQRGKHGKRTRRLPEALVESVKQHVSLFPRSGTPPTGKGFQRQCLADGYSISKMHRMYLDWLQQQDPTATTTPATLRQYRDILSAELRSEFRIIPKEEPMEPMQDDEQDEDVYGEESLGDNDAGQSRGEDEVQYEGGDYDEDYLARALQPHCEITKAEPGAPW